VGKASSAKKVAKVANKSRGTKVRGQRSLLYPVSLIVVVVLGTLLVLYARVSRPSEASVPPVVGDEWTAAFGIYDCDGFAPDIQNTSDLVGDQATGISAAGDGTIRVAPSSDAVAGGNATLGVFFATAGITMTSDRLVVEELDIDRSAGDDCSGKDGELKVLVWDDALADSRPKIFITDFENVRFTDDGMAVTLAFVNGDEDLDELKPPSIAVLGGTAPGPDDSGTTGTTVAEGSETTVSEPTTTVSQPEG
jgi:hypothetical protein